MLQDPVLDLQAQMLEKIKRLEEGQRRFETAEFTPNDMGALLQADFCTEGAQSIPDITWTYVDFDFTTGGTWDLGLAIEDGHGGGGSGIDKIYVAGVPGSTVLNFSVEIKFASNATGYRALRWLAGDGSSMDFAQNAANGIDTSWSDTHRRRQQLVDDWYTVQVYQNSGGPLNLNFCNFIARRVR